MTTPYTGALAGQSPLRMFYTSTCQVLRLQETLQAGGGMTMNWNALSSVVDPVLGEPGLLACLLDLTFLRPGKDQPPPFTAGHAIQRVGVCYFDLAADGTGKPYVLAGDRLECVAGPIFGTFELRTLPDVAQGMHEAHHVETQVVEVAAQLLGNTLTPFPGGQP